jgi:hypothetical protein
MQKRSKFQIRSDASKQRWVRDDRKEAFWRKQISNWKNSGLSKRAFCIENGLTESSFNAWCREIALRDREKTPSTNAEALLRSDPSSTTNSFVPLRLLSDGKESTKSEISNGENQVKRAESKQQLEIIVPGGAVMRVTEDCNLDFVSKMFSTLKGQE